MEERVYAYHAEERPRPLRRIYRERFYAAAPRGRRWSRQEEAWGSIGNSGFHYGAGYDPYSMHVGR